MAALTDGFLGPVIHLPYGEPPNDIENAASGRFWRHRCPTRHRNPLPRCPAKAVAGITRTTLARPRRVEHRRGLNLIARLNLKTKDRQSMADFHQNGNIANTAQSGTARRPK